MRGGLLVPDPGTTYTLERGCVLLTCLGQRLGAAATMRGCLYAHSPFVLDHSGYTHLSWGCSYPTSIPKCAIVGDVHFLELFPICPMMTISETLAKFCVLVSL